MKNRVSISMLIFELSKFGILYIGNKKMTYKIYKKSEKSTNFIGIKRHHIKSGNNVETLRKFLESCALGFYDGVSDIFDKYN